MDDLKIDLDLGDGHTLTFTGWHPDRELNPHYAEFPDIDRAGAIVGHPRADGKEGKCWSGIFFDSETVRQVFGEKPIWRVESWEPLTLSPSLLCRECGDHGFIRDGKWIRA